MALQSGSRLGSYEILAPLGAGGMGEVYRARDAKLGRDVALKILSERLSQDEDALARFAREAKAVGALSHPNILAIHDFAEDQGVAYAVMELLEGETLRERLALGALPARKALEYAVQITRGLAAAHEKGIVHRDLKPENLFLTQDGHVKILDFGLARQRAAAATDELSSPTLSRYTDPGTVMGTAGYMSPEQVRGADVDHRSDIFSFGSILFEMLTGRRAFQRDTAAETMTAILREDPPEQDPASGPLAPALDAVVRHCLEKKPAERFQSARDLAFDLEQVSGSSTRSGPPGSAPERRVHWRLALGALAILLAALGGVLAGRRTVPRSASRPAAHAPSFTPLTDYPGVEAQPNLSPDGKTLLYVADVGGGFDVYSQRVGGTNPSDLTKDSPLDDQNPAFSPDGEQIAFRSERDGGGIFLMGSTGESVRRLTDFGYNPSWSPDGKQIAISTSAFRDPMNRGSVGRLLAVDVATGAKREVLTGADGVQPSWSPHGKRIAYWGLRPGSGQRDLWTAAADGSEAKTGGPAVTNDMAVDWSPEWAPDGTQLYFSSNRGGTMNLWRVPIDEASGRVRGEAEPVTTPSTWSGGMAISGDGKRLAFATVDWRSTLLRVAFDADSGKLIGEPQAILSTNQPVRDHEVSPDGTWLAFTRTGTQEDLFLVRTDGTGYKRLTDDVPRDRAPAWSPDGSEILSYSDRGGSYELWAIHPDGSGLKELTHLGGASMFPTWSPDGARIATAQYGGGALVLSAKDPRGAAPEKLPNPSASLSFWPSSWSNDGARLLGVSVDPDGNVHDVSSYAFATHSFEPVWKNTNSSTFIAARWLADDRRALVRDRSSIYLVDTRTREARHLLSIAGAMIGKSVGVTRDNHWITYSETATEGDVWLMTLD